MVVGVWNDRTVVSPVLAIVACHALVSTSVVILPNLIIAVVFRLSRVGG
jgi:hypothetical protein